MDKKYFVLYEKNGDSFGADEPIDNVDVALDKAENIWQHLTKDERKKCKLKVVIGSIINGMLDFMIGYDLLAEYIYMEDL